MKLPDSFSNKISNKILSNQLKWEAFFPFELHPAMFLGISVFMFLVTTRKEGEAEMV